VGDGGALPDSAGAGCLCVGGGGGARRACDALGGAVGVEGARGAGARACCGRKCAGRA
jgi:hypothetical protein